MGIMVYSLLWIMQDFVHQPFCKAAVLCRGPNKAPQFRKLPISKFGEVAAIPVAFQSLQDL